MLWGIIVGAVAVGVVSFLAWMMVVVIGGLSREGERKAAKADAARRRDGHAARRAQIVQEAQRQLAIKQYMERMEQQQRTDAER